ncbi:TolC family protein [Xylophilus sp. GOD-11R]|uniref:TolC family protein n=1 Tax=Xylophilus sp. GOD-11R TaxID=3089814 RepID=UPI00298D5577|nr:TolC family protein [Xylophilus sp. GOD-11R]WPB56984.1 TolC family protein [Xylophilus sp. GOD-11R]
MSIRQLFWMGGLGLAMPLAAQTAAPVPVPAAPAALTLTAQAAQAMGAPYTLTLAQALAAARENLDVAIAQGNLAAARADILAADHAPLPVLSGVAENIDLKNGVGAGNAIRDKRIDKTIGLDWTYERGDKRLLRTAAAERAAAAASADVDDVRVHALITALAAYYDLLAAQDRAVEVGAIAGSAGELSRASDRRVQAGDLPAQDAARTAIEAQRARADVQQAELDRLQAAATLTQAMGARGAGRTMPRQLRADGYTALPPVDVERVDLASLAENRPDVRAASARVQSAQASLDGAIALKKGDVTIGAGFEHYPGVSTRLIQFRASMPLQWGYSFEGEIGRAQASFTQAEDALDKARRDAILELQGLQQTALTAQRRTQGYEVEILPRARRVAEGAELAFRRGAIPLVDLLDARRTLRATLLEAIDARTDYAKAAGAWTLQTQPGLLLAP